jgi:hypothetical protein
MADNGRDAGFFEVWTRLSTGRLKVFHSLRHWLDEFRVFARDSNGQVIQEAKFHGQAATRYLLLNRLGQWRPEKPRVQKPLPEYSWPSQNAQNWMQ